MEGTGAFSSDDGTQHEDLNSPLESELAYKFLLQLSEFQSTIRHCMEFNGLLSRAELENRIDLKNKNKDLEMKGYKYTFSDLSVKGTVVFTQ